MNATKPLEPEPLWTVEETARYLNMSKSWVYRHTENGEIPHAKFGRITRYSPARIRQYQEELHTVAQGGNVVRLPTRRR